MAAEFRIVGHLGFDLSELAVPAEGRMKSEGGAPRGATAAELESGLDAR